MSDLNNVFYLTAGSLQPVFTADFYDASGTPLNLSLATGAKFRLRAETGTALLISNAVAALGGVTNSHMEYDWKVADWTPVAGRYLAEVEIDFASGGPLVLPVSGYWHIIVRPILP